jgi:hypothetical protein
MNSPPVRTRSSLCIPHGRPKNFSVLTISLEYPAFVDSHDEHSCPNRKLSTKADQLQPSSRVPRSSAITPSSAALVDWQRLGLSPYVELVEGGDLPRVAQGGDEGGWERMDVRREPRCEGGEDGVHRPFLGGVVDGKGDLVWPRAHLLVRSCFCTCLLNTTKGPKCRRDPSARVDLHPAQTGFEIGYIHTERVTSRVVCQGKRFRH